MNNGGNENRPTGENERTGDGDGDGVGKDVSIAKETAGAPPPPNASTEYKQTHAYAYIYLGTQIAIATFALGGIVAAICTLKDLNRNVTDAHNQAVAAATANVLTREQIEAEVRPVLTINGFMLACNTLDRMPCAGIDNSGKSPTNATIRKHASFSSDRLPAGPPLPNDTETLVIPPTGPNSNRIDFGQRFGGGQVGYFYLVGRMEYGNGYFTNFCREYEIASTRKGKPVPSKEHECQDPKSNEIK